MNNGGVLNVFHAPNTTFDNRGGQHEQPIYRNWDADIYRRCDGNFSPSFYLIGGIWLAVLGGSWYYIIAGLLMLAISGILKKNSKQVFMIVYAALMLGTVIWGLWEVGSDFWALAPRFDILGLLGLWLLIPAVTRGM